MKISVLSPFHLRCIIILGNSIGISFDQLLHIFSSLNTVIGFRPGCLPVIPGKIGNCSVLEIIEICLIKLVGDLISCCRRHCVSSCIKAVLFIGYCQFFISICIHAVFCCIAFCSKDIVQCIMCTVSNCKIIITSVHDIGLCCCVIITCKVFLRSCNLHSFRFTRLQLFCFFKTYQLNGSFLHIVFFVIICVRSLCIKLYNIFTCHISCIFYFNGNCYGITLVIEVFDILFKCCVGKSVSESIGNLVIIIPCSIVIGGSC